MAVLTKRLPAIALLVVTSALLQACVPIPASTENPPDADQGAAGTAAADPPSDDVAAGQKVPELTLNLPASKDCQCVAPQDGPDHTFLERGYTALAQGDHIEAVQHFQRYQRLEDSPLSDWEAGMAIAYVSMLPTSPFFDPEAARKTYRRLNKLLTPQWQTRLHEKSLLMRESLETFVVLDRHIADLEANNATLKQDLEKREEALRRLRELTLGQRGARQ